MRNIQVGAIGIFERDMCILSSRTTSAPTGDSERSDAILGGFMQGLEFEACGFGFSV